jgi:hypothetical protein
VCVAASIVARGCAGRCSFVIERKTQFPAPLPVSAAIFQHTRNNNNKKIKKSIKKYSIPFLFLKKNEAAFMPLYTNSPVQNLYVCN